MGILQRRQGQEVMDTKHRDTVTDTNVPEITWGQKATAITMDDTTPTDKFNAGHRTNIADMPADMQSAEADSDGVTKVRRWTEWHSS